MMKLTDIKKVATAKWVQGEISSNITGISIDSRKVKKGNVFIAIKGDRLDGHDFIRKAIHNGATAVVVSKKVICPKHISVLQVSNTTKAFGQIAAWHRKRFSIPVVAITGSTGKTTTKDMVAAVLKARFKVLKNVGTQNNQYGVPLTLLKLNSSHQAAVLELGTNQPGDIRWLAQMVCPTMSILTNIGESHLEKLKAPAGVFREKAQLINYIPPGGIIIVNGDDRYLASLPKKYKGHKVIRFGCSQGCNYKASNINIEKNLYIRFKINRHIVKINSPATHNIYNALAAISCGLALKIRYNDIIAALRRFRFQGGRQEISKIGRLWLIDDTYNANPVSLKSAVNTLDRLRIKGKKIVVCADMLELGSRSIALHRSAGKMIGRSGADVVLTTGPHARYITQGLNESKRNSSAFHCKDIKEMKEQIKKCCRPGDAVLVKGSRAMHMERVVDFLKESFAKSS